MAEAKREGTTSKRNAKVQVRGGQADEGASGDMPRGEEPGELTKGGQGFHYLMCSKQVSRMTRSYHTLLGAFSAARLQVLTR